MITRSNLKRVTNDLTLVENYDLAIADTKMCYGIEFDDGQAELCRNRLEQYGVPRENIVTGDCLDNKTWEKLPCYKKEFNVLK